MKPESKAWLVKFGLTLILGLGILTRSSCMIGNPSEENDRPEGPSGLGARLGSIHLTWQDNSDNEDGFIIERKIGNAGQFQQVGRVGADVTAYEDHYTPEQNMPVFYRVVAFNSKGQSNYSNTALVNSILWSGYQDVKIYGNYAYCSNANGLVVFDLAMLGAPKKVATLMLGINGSGGIFMTNQKIVVGPGPYLYMTYGNGGLKIVDISDPTHPRLIATFPTAGYAHHVSVDTDGTHTYALVAEGRVDLNDYIGVEIVEVSDPENPVLVTAIPFDDVQNGFLDYPYAYIADGNSGLRIYDLSALPAYLEVSQFPTAGYAFDVVVRNNFAYVTLPATLDALQIIDVSDPSNPLPAGLWTQAENQLPYSLPTVFLDGDYAYFTDQFVGIYALNISNPAAPSQVGFVSRDGADGVASNVYKYYQHLFVVDKFKGLYIYTLKLPPDPFSATLLGSYYTFGSVEDVAAKETGDGRLLAFVTTFHTGLQIVDVSDPGQPKRVSSVENIYAKRVIVRGDYVYVIDYFTLWIIDISRPERPTIVSGYNFNGPGYDFFLKGQYAYIAEYNHGVEIVRISDPTFPFFVGIYPSAGPAWSIYLGEDGNGYIAEETGLELVDATNPWKLVPLSSFADPGVTKVYAQAGFAYLIDDNGFVVVDISRPAAPRLAGRLILDHYPLGLLLKNNLAYVADYNGGVVQIDVTDRSHPRSTDVITTPGEASDLVIERGIFLIADTYSFLIIK